MFAKQKGIGILLRIIAKQKENKDIFFSSLEENVTVSSHLKDKYLKLFVHFASFVKLRHFA
jgi:hypothetical protein